MSNSRISIRVSSRDRKLLDTVCEARGENKSCFIRRAVRKELAMLSFLNENEKKALGIVKKK